MAKAKPAERIPILRPASEQGVGFLLSVIFTTAEGTRRALHLASRLARDLNMRAVLLAPRVVPYPLAIENPPVSTEFMERAISQLASEQELEITAAVYLCRDRNEAIRRVLTPDSLVVIGSRNRWWPTTDDVLARLLKRDGHSVILVDSRRPHLLEIESAKIKSPLSAI